MEVTEQTKDNLPLEAIKGTLNIEILNLVPLGGGTNERTFVAKTEKGDFIVRIENIGGLQLRRAYNAQEKARKLDVSVPRVVAHNFNNTQAGLWTIEDKIEGVQFYPDQMSDEEAGATAVDLGRQLKIIHSVPCDRFGLIPPYPYASYEDWWKADAEQVQRSESLTGPVFKTFQEYIEFKKSKIEEALKILKIDPKYIDEIKNIYSQLEYEDVPRFCGGDTATTNILVNNGKVSAIIDWEWANGSDPAENIAAWSYWNKDTKHLDNLLRGYEPENLADFRKRVFLYEIVCAVNLAYVYKGLNDNSGIEQTKVTLERKLENKLWK